MHFLFTYIHNLVWFLVHDYMASHHITNHTILEENTAILIQSNNKHPPYRILKSHH